MAAADSTLWGALYSQVHPYDWMVREVDRLRRAEPWRNGCAVIPLWRER